MHRTMNRNLMLLVAAQILFQSVGMIVMALSGLVGASLLGEDKSLATLPIAMISIGAAIAMIPAALLMARFGRKAGFLLGASCGVVAGILSCVAIVKQHFGLFVVANLCVGFYQGFAQYYRFAAAESVTSAAKSIAIAWVIGGGVVAALLGNQLITHTMDLSTTPFLITYACLIVLSLLASGVITQLKLKDVAVNENQSVLAARPLSEIIKQPLYLKALLSSSIAYSIMVLVMTATPLWMKLCGHSIGASSAIIQWHVLSMFVPSFFSGKLIQRIGHLNTMMLGALLLIVASSVALLGHTTQIFLMALICLGVGWNLMYIGGSSLLTETYQPNERSKAQATHDFIVFGCSSIASLLAGVASNVKGGWQLMNQGSILIALVFVIFLLGTRLFAQSKTAANKLSSSSR